MKLQCKEHNRTFKGGQGLAAHMRAFHRPNGNPITPTVDRPESLHLNAALDVLDSEIGQKQGELQTLQARRGFIAKALGE